MHIRLPMVGLLVAVLAAPGGAAATPAPAGAAPDVRILMDGSASMAQSDPGNARGKGLALLARLLPDTGHAGIWVYRDAVTAVAEHGPNTPLWKENAAILAAGLEASGAEADLLAALETVTWDRDPAPSGASSAGSGSESESHDGRGSGAGPVHVIVITDGGLAGSADSGMDRVRSRRLLGELAPQLAAASIRVHTLALGARADVDLLAQLASATGGYHGQIEDPAELPQALVTVLDGIAGPAGLPVDEQGAFQVAPGTRSMTLQRLGAGLDRPGVLIDPGANRLPRDARRDRVRWHVDGDRELVTVMDPAPGTWRFEGAAGGVEVRAYGDVGVAYRDLPGTLFPADVRSYELDVTSAGRPIRDAEFLALVEVSARLHGPERVTPLVVERVQSGAAFRVNLLGPHAPGEYLLETLVAGPTFAQTHAQPLRLINPLGLEIRPADDGFVIWARVAAPELDHASLRLAALVTRPPAATRLIPFERQPAGLWKLVVPGARGLVEVALDLSGNYLNYREFDLRTDPIRVVLPVKEVQRVNLDMDGRRIIVAGTPGKRPAAAPLPPAPGASTLGAGARPPAVAGGPSADAGSELELPGWFAVAAAILNLLLGVGVWWLVGDPERRAELEESTRQLRQRLGIEDPEAADSESAGEPEDASAGESPAEKPAQAA